MAHMTANKKPVTTKKTSKPVQDDREDQKNMSQEVQQDTSVTPVEVESEDVTVPFTELDLDDRLQKAIADYGYETATPIQSQAIPLALAHKDVVGIAQTGTGKTAAFSLPILHHILNGRRRAKLPRALILSPTRELAAQIEENVIAYTKGLDVRSVLLVGGVGSFRGQEKALKDGVDILIATPGRLLDMIDRGKVMTAYIDLFVLDEADRMLDMGFIPDITEIVKNLPGGLYSRLTAKKRSKNAVPSSVWSSDGHIKQGTQRSQPRQTLMFTATMPDSIKGLVGDYMMMPETVEVSRPAMTAETVTQFALAVDGRRKARTLRDLLSQEKPSSCIVFCNRKNDVDRLAKVLKKDGVGCVALHGDMSQPQRYRSLEAFKSGEVTTIICSDVAARGLDIPDVSHVINYDLPKNTDDYVHRIGRTGRAGQTGIAISLVSKDQVEIRQEIEKASQFSFEVYPHPQDTSEDTSENVSKKETPSFDTGVVSMRGEVLPPISGGVFKGFGDAVPAFMQI